MTEGKITLLLENPSKGNNLGSILRCAVAFGIKEIHTIGYETCAVMGAHGANKHIRLIAFPTVEQAFEHLKRESFHLVGLLGPNPLISTESPLVSVITNEKNEQVVGISWASHAKTSTFSREMTSKAVKNDIFPVSFKKNTCLVLCKTLAHGLPIHLANVCDEFVHVPHHRVPAIISDTTLPHQQPDPIYLFDTPTCLSITLYHLTKSLNMIQRSTQDHKYQVAIQQNHASDEAVSNERKRRREERLQERQEPPGGVGGDVLGLFHKGSGDY